MESGNIVEYIDRQKIICAVVLEGKNQKLRLLNENNREVKLSENRLSHSGKSRLNPSMGRDKLVESLKERVSRRNDLAEEVDIRELWEILNTEQEWIDLDTMTEFCFSEASSADHSSAVIRAFFKDRTYFKFNADRFFPNTEEQVGQIIAQAEEAARKNRIVEEGGTWLRNVQNEKNPVLPQDKPEFAEILKSFYLFQKESKYYALGKEMLTRAGIKTEDALFRILVKVGIWEEDENLDIYLYDAPVSFSDKVMRQGEKLIAENTDSGNSQLLTSDSGRRDLSDLPLMTIDGQSTSDFDDALSIENKGDHYYVGVHISDVAHFVRPGDPIDREAILRASSIYMPDLKISMLPSCLSDDLCSLRAGEQRPAISTMIKINPGGGITDYEIFPSLIRVREQLTYSEANRLAEDDENIRALYGIAKKFRQKRLSEGAVQISLPEISLWLDDGKLLFSREDRETSGRLLVSELMIMANWLTAKFLAEQNISAIYRTQPPPKERLYKDDGGTLFQNWMQRKFLSRFVLQPWPEPHSGLGLNAYVTATSPIRKYSDLITQRQIRSAFGLDTPSASEEIERAIQMLEQPMTCVSKLQYRRKRYWLLKHLEGRIGEREKAIVLSRRRNDHMVLLTEYMTECSLPVSGSAALKPEDVIQVTVQHANARKDTLSVFMS